MIHDIDVINTSIRLGDKVFPPEGCKIRWWCSHHEKSLVGIVEFVSGVLVYCDHVFFNNTRIDTRFCSPSYSLIRDTNLEILSIPDNTPPFEEWKRL